MSQQPTPDERFDLIIIQHGAYTPSELYRLTSLSLHKNEEIHSGMI